MLVSLAIAALLHIATANQDAIEVQGTTLTLSGIPYYVPSQAVGRLSHEEVLNESTSFALRPITVITADASSFRIEDLQALESSFCASDDVFQARFLSRMLGIYVHRSIATDGHSTPHPAQRIRQL